MQVIISRFRYKKDPAFAIAADKAAKETLGGAYSFAKPWNFGAAIKVKAMKSIKPRAYAGSKKYPYGRPSKPGQKPRVPSYWTPYTKSPLRNLIGYQVKAEGGKGSDKQYVLTVGPKYFQTNRGVKHIVPSPGKTVPNVLEFGGTQRRRHNKKARALAHRFGKQRSKVIQYEPRPFMSVAFEAIVQSKYWQRRAFNVGFVRIFKRHPDDYGILGFSQTSGR